MTKDDLQNLVEFNYWARDRMFDATTPLTAEQFTKDLGNSFKSIRDTMVHTYSAEWVWYQRWNGTSPTEGLTFTDYPDLQTLMNAWDKLEAEIRTLIAGLDDEGVNRVHQYRFMNGQATQSVFWQMFQHVVNHGSYHRGQVTTMLRQLGADPPKSTDMITYYREKNA